jgi:hypothetical protein
MRAKRFYPRFDPMRVGQLLRQLALTIESAGWEERGGFLLRDPDTSEVIGRTKWVPRAQWWAERPDYLSEQQTAGILLKHLRMEPLTGRERRCLEHLVRTAGIILDDSLLPTEMEVPCG